MVWPGAAWRCLVVSGQARHGGAWQGMDNPQHISAAGFVLCFTLGA